MELRHLVSTPSTPTFCVTFLRVFVCVPAAALKVLLWMNLSCSGPG